MDEKKGFAAYRELARKHWKLTLGIILLCALGAYIASLFVTPVYQGTVRIRIDLSRSTGVLKTAIGTPFFVADPFQTQVNLIKSRVVAEGVVREMGLNIYIKEKPRNSSLEFTDPYFVQDFEGGTYLMLVRGDGFELQDSKKNSLGYGKFGEIFKADQFFFVVKEKGLRDGDRVTLVFSSIPGAAYDLVGRVKVLMEGPTEMMDIIVTASSPEQSARLANAYARQYSSFTTEMDRQRSATMRQFIEEQLVSLRAELDSLESDLAVMKKKYGIFEADLQGQMILESMGELEKERVELTSALAILKKQFPTAYDSSSILGSLSDSGYSMREAELVALRSERARLSSVYKPDHPAMQLLDAQIASLEKVLAANRIEVYRKGIAEIDQLYGNLEAQLGDFPAKMMELQRLNMRVEAGEDVYASLLRNLYEARMNEHQEYGIAVIVDSALPDPVPVQPKKKFNTLLGLLAGILLSVIAVFIIEALDVTAKSKSELERLLGTGCLAVVPRFDNDTGGMALAGEAFKLLALGLDYSKLRGEVKTIVVTSASAGEGKSTLAVGLARSLSDMGKRVLLVDSDMHKPALHERFNVPLMPGLSDVLAGKKNLSEVARPIDGVQLVTGGTIPPDPSILLTNESLDGLIAGTAGNFDYMIFDSPPILPVTDAVKIGGWASGVVLVVRYAQTRRSDAAEAVSRLKTGRCNTLGFVFNGVPLEIKRYTGKYHPSEKPAGWWARAFGRRRKK